MTIITIPKKIAENEELIAIPRKEYEAILHIFKVAKETKQITEKDVLRWSKEAKKLKKEGKLPLLRSLKALR